jgi:Leucine-rich repeat (LRR) protein
MVKLITNTTDRLLYIVMDLIHIIPLMTTSEFNENDDQLLVNSQQHQLTTKFEPKPSEKLITTTSSAKNLTKPKESQTKSNELILQEDPTLTSPKVSTISYKISTRQNITTTRHLEKVSMDYKNHSLVFKKTNRKTSCIVLSASLLDYLSLNYSMNKLDLNSKWCQANIRLIKNKSFLKFKNLEELVLSSNRIELIASDAFRGLEYKLKLLKLNSNQISEFSNGKKSCFQNLFSLQQLDLSLNKIKSIDNIFQIGCGLNSLLTLDLKMNKLQRLSSDTFNGLTNLKRLSLESNEMTQLAPDSFRGLDRIEQLTLSDNNIVQIELGTFNQLTSLKELNLSLNKMPLIGKQMFEGLISLQLLDLSRNRILRIGPSELVGLNNLIELNLSGKLAYLSY